MPDDNPNDADNDDFFFLKHPNDDLPYDHLTKDQKDARMLKLLNEYSEASRELVYRIEEFRMAQRMAEEHRAEKERILKEKGGIEQIWLSQNEAMEILGIKSENTFKKIAHKLRRSLMTGKWRYHRDSLNDLDTLL